MKSIECPECGTPMLSCENTCPLCGSMVFNSDHECGGCYESENELDFNDDRYISDSY